MGTICNEQKQQKENKLKGNILLRLQLLIRFSEKQIKNKLEQREVADGTTTTTTITTMFPTPCMRVPHSPACMFPHGMHVPHPPHACSRISRTHVLPPCKHFPSMRTIWNENSKLCASFKPRLFYIQKIPTNQDRRNSMPSTRRAELPKTKFIVSQNRHTSTEAATQHTKLPHIIQNCNKSYKAPAHHTKLPHIIQSSTRYTKHPYILQVYKYRNIYIYVCIASKLLFFGSLSCSRV